MARFKRQRGIALLVALVTLILVMLLGVSAARLSIQAEKAARGDRDRDVAFQAAEDALADAELDVRNGVAPVSDCAAAPSVPSLPPVPVMPGWQRVDLSGAEDGGKCTVGYGEHTGAAMRTGEGAESFQRPRYLIERMECHQPGEDASAAASSRYCYRVTVMGFGAKPGTEAVLQTVYGKPE